MRVAQVPSVLVGLFALHLACVPLGRALAQSALDDPAAAPGERTGLEVLRDADAALRSAAAIAFTVRREGSGAQATREPSTVARVVVQRRDDATRAGLTDSDGTPQWHIAAYGIIASPDGTGDPEPFAFSMDGERARYIDASRGAVVASDREYAHAILTDSSAWTAIQWLSEWETLVGKPIVDDTPRESPQLDGSVLIDGEVTHAVYVDLAEFPNTYAFGAWWYIGAQDSLPRRMELVYYDVRGEDNVSRGDGISRLTLSDVRVLDTPADVAEAVQLAASLLAETNWRQPGEPPIAELLDPQDPFMLPAPDGFEVVAYEPPVDERRAQRAADPQINIPAPDFTLLDPDGNSHTLSSYRGKIVILDFWATWCGPCLMVMPDLNAVHEQFKDQGVVVVGVNAWENGDPAALMKARNWDYLLLLNGDQVASQYQVSGIPTMVVVDQNGMIVERHVGASSDIKASLTETITRLQAQN